MNLYMYGLVKLFFLPSWLKSKTARVMAIKRQQMLAVFDKQLCIEFLEFIENIPLISNNVDVANWVQLVIK